MNHTAAAPAKGQRHLWTQEEVALLREIYPHCHTSDVAALLQLNVGQCYAAAAQYGITKSADYLASTTAARIQRGKQHPNMVAHRFQKGLAPWNKGTHYKAGGRSVETRFKAGRPASEARNYVPIGSYRISAEGYLERKVTDDPSMYPARRWKPVARLVWEAANGPVPRSHMVAFKPGQRTAILELITIDRLECISRAENARRNHPRNKHPELGRLVQLKGAITRQVNRITREAQETAKA